MERYAHKLFTLTRGPLWEADRAREIVAFGLWMPLAIAAAALPVPALLWTAVAAGLVAVFCSAMVYIDTRRPSWRAARTLPGFFAAVAAGTIGGFVPPLAPLAYVAFWFERRRYFRAMTVLKMPGN